MPSEVMEAVATKDITHLDDDLFVLGLSALTKGTCIPPVRRFLYYFLETLIVMVRSLGTTWIQGKANRIAGRG